MFGGIKMTFKKFEPYFMYLLNFVEIAECTVRIFTLNLIDISWSFQCIIWFMRNKCKEYKQENKDN